MAVDADLFGTQYLDAESFREHAALFGVGMSFDSDYPVESPDSTLNRVLQAASRSIDAFCCRDFDPANKTETHALNEEWQFTVNNPPVSSVVSCTLRYAVDGSISISTADLFINNQQGYIEIAGNLEAGLASAVGQLSEAQVEVVYKSLQSVPATIKLATGHQAGYLINNGFANKIMPPNFGKLDIGGMSINNKKGSKPAEEQTAAGLAPEAERLLMPFRQFAAA